MGHCSGKELQRAVTSFLPSLSALPVVEVSLASSSSIDKETTLTCSAWDFYPGDIQLSWSKGSQLLTNSTRNDSLFHNSNGSYSYISNLVVSKHDWNEFAQFSCQVNHSTLKMPVVKNLILTQSASSDYNLHWIPVIPLGVLVILAAIIVAKSMKLRFKSTSQSSAERGLPETTETHPPQESQNQSSPHAEDHAPLKYLRRGKYFWIGPEHSGKIHRKAAANRQGHRLHVQAKPILKHKKQLSPESLEAVEAKTPIIWRTYWGNNYFQIENNSFQLFEAKLPALKQKSNFTQKKQALAMQFHNKEMILCFMYLLWISGPMIQPTAIALSSKMVSALQGEMVKTVCAQNIDETEGFAINLRRNGSSAELCYIQLGNFPIWSRNCTDRINLEYNKPTKGVYVVMERVSVKDSGVYSCTLDRTLPPPVRTLSQSNISLTVSALPVVEVSLASSSSIDKETTLTCSAWDFYPGDIQLSWSKGSQLLTNSTRNDSLFHNSNGSYSYISNLVVSKHDWNEFAQFSCQVNHSTLKMPVVKNLTLTQSASSEMSSPYLRAFIMPSMMLLMMLISYVVLKKYTKPSQEIMEEEQHLSF
ncbi:60S ribosomal protein L7 [Platysternon megacephalum]|uniref:60S ribosomal protein L7 n=1 Tax=Platysternon megacephalum TaxID=55544 RepID=A0A4D9ECY6_9SAUR|nr:60S ribosomal protein L7 [Platysternon megacephalum]